MQNSPTPGHLAGGPQMSQLQIGQNQVQPFQGSNVQAQNYQTAQGAPQPFQNMYGGFGNQMNPVQNQGFYFNSMMSNFAEYLKGQMQSNQAFYQPMQQLSQAQPIQGPSDQSQGLNQSSSEPKSDDKGFVEPIAPARQTDEMDQGSEEGSSQHNLIRTKYDEEFPIIRNKSQNQNERSSAYSEAYSSAESDFNRKRDRDNLSTASEEQSPRKQTGVLRSNVRAKIYSYQGVKYHPGHPELSLFIEENGLSKNEIREIRTSRGANRMQQRFQIFKGDDD